MESYGLTKVINFRIQNILLTLNMSYNVLMPRWPCFDRFSCRWHSTLTSSYRGYHRSKRETCNQTRLMLQYGKLINKWTPRVPKLSRYTVKYIDFPFDSPWRKAFVQKPGSCAQFLSKNLALLTETLKS